MKCAKCKDPTAAVIELDDKTELALCQRHYIIYQLSWAVQEAYYKLGVYICL